MQYSEIYTRITCLYGSHLGFSFKTATFGAELQVYGSQTPPVVLCMQNSVINIRIASLYGSQPSCVAFGCKTATFGAE